MTQKVTTPIEPDQVLSTYNGKANRCCCGCSGTHSYPESRIAREVAGLKRGYPIGDDECSNRKMAFVIRKLNANLDKVEDGGSYWALDTGSRVYIAYKLTWGN